MNNVIASASMPSAESTAPQANATQQKSSAPPPEPPVKLSALEPPRLDVPSSEEVFAAADQVTAFLQDNNSTRSLRIAMNENLDRPVFTVVDSETNEIVRHIPSDQVVAMAKFIEQWVPDADEVMPQGILFDGIV
jgi:flagellar protein FlaG